MAYKWKPSKSQKKEFAIKMQNPEERASYEDRKNKKAEQRRSTSKFDYEKAGGFYIPTLVQNDASREFLLTQKLTEKERNACADVLYGYSCQEKIHHDSIHIVNELIRNKLSL